MGEEKETSEVGDDPVSHALCRIFFTRKVAFFEKKNRESMGYADQHGGFCEKRRRFSGCEQESVRFEKYFDLF